MYIKDTCCDISCCIFYLHLIISIFRKVGLVGTRQFCRCSAYRDTTAQIRSFIGIHIHFLNLHGLNLSVRLNGILNIRIGCGIILNLLPVLVYQFHGNTWPVICLFIRLFCLFIETVNDDLLLCNISGTIFYNDMISSIFLDFQSSFGKLIIYHFIRSISTNTDRIEHHIIIDINRNFKTGSRLKLRKFFRKRLTDDNVWFYGIFRYITAGISFASVCIIFYHAVEGSTAIDYFYRNSMFFQRSVVEIYRVTFIIFTGILTISVFVLFGCITKAIVTGDFHISGIEEINTSCISGKGKGISLASGTNITVVWKHSTFFNGSNIFVFPLLSAHGIGKFKYRIIGADIASGNG